MKKVVSLFALFLFFAVGYYIASSSGEFPGYDFKLAQLAPANKARDPAAIQRVFDFSRLEGNALNFALKQRLVSGAKVLKGEGGIGIALGHFVVRSDDGQKEFACQRYSKVVLFFEGVGMAVSGESPKMEVEGNCEISADINSISPLWIPVARILGEKVADQEFDFRDEHPVKVSFSNVSRFQML